MLVHTFMEEGFSFLRLWLKVRNSVPGWCDMRDARELFAFARQGPGAGAIVEIGSAWGRSTVFLAWGSKLARREPVYAIDPHTGDPWFLSGEGNSLLNPRSDGYEATNNEHFGSYTGFLQTLERFGIRDWVVPVVSTSSEAARVLDTGPIRLLFVDGLHTYEGVQADIQEWVPRVIPGGIIVFDDYWNNEAGVGVRQAVDELLGSGLVEPRLRRSFMHVWTTKR